MGTDVPMSMISVRNSSLYSQIMWDNKKSNSQIRGAESENNCLNIIRCKNGVMQLKVNLFMTLDFAPAVQLQLMVDMTT